MELRDRLLGALIGLVRATDGAARVFDSTWKTVVEDVVLAADCQDTEALSDAVTLAHVEKFKIVPDCASCANPCGRTSDYDLSTMEPETAPLKRRILEAIVPLARKAKADMEQGIKNEEAAALLYQCLFSVGEDIEKEPLEEMLAQL